MKSNRILPLILLAGLLPVCLSCTREELENPARKEVSNIPVSLTLSVENMEDGTPGTKAVMEPEISGGETIEQQIKNFVVLQYEGSDENARLVANPTFVEDVLDYFHTHQVSLLPSEIVKTYVFVVVANIIDPDKELPGVNTTLGSFLRKYYSLGKYDSVFTSGGGNNYLRMSGSAQYTGKIDNFFSIEIPLKRNVAKITINVTNTTGTGADDGGPHVTLDKVQLRDINAKYYYLTNVGAGIGAAFQDEYSAVAPCRIDKDQEAFPAAGNEGSPQTFTYYVPANLRGTIVNDAQYTKGKDAPEGATRFCLYGTYGSENTPISYTYYLGGNLIDNFDLKPNHRYTYNLTLKTKGDARYDYRIEDMEEVKFHVDANCYMVHPPKAEGQSRVYSIPIRRAATFWNDPGVNGGVYGANQFETDSYSSCKIDANTAWTAEVLWSDFPLTDFFTDPSEFLVKNSGHGYDPTQPTQDPYFKFKIKNGMRGNVVIAAKLGDRIVWSWHIWITDYNPDQEGLTPKDGSYVYDVEGGQVHRYDNDLFKTEPTETVVGYKNGFIMDRNLGASGSSYDKSLAGALYYQFGRKDPFFFQTQAGTRYRYYEKGVTLKDLRTVRYLDNGSGYYRVLNYKTGEPVAVEGKAANNIRFSVCNPMLFIYSTDVKGDPTGWTNNFDALASIGDGWFDPQYYSHNGDQHILEIKKSIYDPCPAGWKVPHNGSFNDIIPNNENHLIRGYDKVYHNSGLYYYPEGDKNKGNIFFPASSYRSYAGLYSTDYLTNHGRLSTDYSLNEQTGNFFYYNNTESRMFLLRTTYGYPVRCVREYGVVEK